MKGKRMIDKDNQHSFVKTYVIAVIICIGFLAFSLLFIFHIMRLNQQESANYLNESAQQSQTSVEKQISGDFQTLDGIAERSGCFKRRPDRPAAQKDQ